MVGELVLENGGLLVWYHFRTGLWINPTFQWKVSALDQSDPIWDSLEHLEVSLMKGLAFDITFDDSENLCYCSRYEIYPTSP